MYCTNVSICIMYVCFVYMFVCMCMHVCMYVCMYVSMCICVYVRMCMYVCMYVCACMDVFVCVSVCMCMLGRYATHAVLNLDKNDVLNLVQGLLGTSETRRSKDQNQKIRVSERQ